MLAGKIYNPHDKELRAISARAHALCIKYNGTPETCFKKREKILDGLLPNRARELTCKDPSISITGYLQRSGKNFYANFNLTVLDTCLVTIARLMAPYSPFYADKLFIDLMAPAAAAAGTEPRSVHLSDFPSVDESLIDADLEERMRLAQVITSLVLSLRRKVNIKVRQPLSTLMIPVVSERQRQAIEAMAPLILSEVNVKKLKFVASDEGILVKRIKPDFKKLGRNSASR